MRKAIAEDPAAAAPARQTPSECSRHHPSWRPPSGDLEWGAQTLRFGKTPKPEVEKRIVDEVGSYGRQIGWILEAMEVVIEALRADHNGPLSRDRLDDAEIAKLAKLDALVKAVEAVKKS